MIPGFGRDVRSLWFIQTWCSHDVPMMSLDHPTVSSVKDHAAAAPKCAKWPQMDLFAGAHGVILNRWLDHIICFEKWMFNKNSSTFHQQKCRIDVNIPALKHLRPFAKEKKWWIVAHLLHTRLMGYPIQKTGSTGSTNQSRPVSDQLLLLKKQLHKLYTYQQSNIP